MNNQINQEQHPYGLGGGTILTGSMSVSGEFFWFHPVSSSVATLKLSSPEGTIPSTTYPNGIGVYGFITEVTQSSGTSIVYLGTSSEPRYNTFNPYPSPSPSLTATPTVTPSITATPSVTPSITVSTSITPSVTATPSLTPSLTPSISISRTPSLTPTRTPSITVSVTITPTRTPSVTPSTSRP